MPRLPLAYTIVLLVIVLSSVLALPQPSSACTCIPPPPPSDALFNSDAVFSGRVLAIKHDEDLHTVTATIKVYAIWKGSPPAIVDVITADDGAACGFWFELGQSFLVYAYGDFEELSTHICTRTTRLDFAFADLDALGPPLIVSNERPSWGLLKQRFEP